jgi:hypothetical protein
MGKYLAVGMRGLIALSAYIVKIMNSVTAKIRGKSCLPKIE